ncbi:GntR family transcriptional regulator [Maritimibacter sp. HL-12]|jgi:GntR family transcriptional regulator, vanillate catabolism transcriptional regulator|uniref:GntR family transcriptional regulator n=1 Tax=Maritimibacter sp. HL-12 TaxID=1162418 RepID=UPI000A0F1F9D|nr:GntR family transcriptional regulator [Maritimibacter sp. HL-12]SMH41906.1 transcriptional regulator, GntR family [Maritimibacter sp. HL-12]
MPDSKGSTHTKRATYELRHRIIEGQLAGGTRLYEVALAEELEISRTPVREAMSRLAEEGLLERASGGGFVVRSFTYRDVIDAIELRGVLEGTAARLAAERGADANKIKKIKSIVTEIDGCFGAIDAPADFDRYSELNARFHDALAQLCDSAIILRELERVKSLPFASPSAFVLGRRQTLAAHRGLVIAQMQHRALVEAIELREGARAEALAREHARIARHNLETSQKEENNDFTLPGMSLVID